MLRNITKASDKTVSMAVFTLEDEQIVWNLSVWCEFMPYCRGLVRLDRQIVLAKSSFQTAKYQTVCLSKKLFVPFAHQANCSSETTCPSRRFVRPFVRKRPKKLTNTAWYGVFVGKFWIKLLHKPSWQQDFKEYALFLYLQFTLATWLASTKSITSGEVYNKNRRTLVTDTEIILWTFVESSFHLTVESNQRLLWFSISVLRDWLKQLTPLYIQSEKAITKRDSRANISPRFASGTELLGVLTGSLDCVSLLWWPEWLLWL